MSDTVEIQYGECCCCLEKGDHRELTKLYYLDKRPEIYEVLFKDTFGIEIKYPENTKLICDMCIVELRQAKHFRFMVESTQQRLSFRVNWQPEFDNVTKDPLEVDFNIESIKCESDNQMEEADNDEQQSECAVEEVNYDAEETDIKEEKSVVEEPSQQTNTDSIKHESNDDMEGVATADHPDIQHHSDASTSSSDKSVITRHKMKTLRVLLTRSPTVEQLLSNDSNCQYNSKEKLFVFKTANQSNLQRVIFRYKTTLKGNETGHMRTHTHTASKGELTRHIRTHTGKYLFSCHICQYKTFKNEHLIKHIRTHTGEKPFSCKICEFETAEESNLSKHIRIHTKQQQFFCDICKYRAARKGQLKDHLSIHTGKKPFSCDICEYKTTRKENLKDHLRIHTGEKPFSCDICQYRATRKEHLKNHLRIHTGEKPFSCDICQYRTANKVRLKNHLRIHTGEKPFSCDICQYRAARKESLSKHLLTHTKKKLM